MTLRTCDLEKNEPDGSRAQLASPSASQNPRAGAVLQLQRLIGNRATSRVLSGLLRGEGKDAGTPGQPLPTATRARMEHAFGRSFADAAQRSRSRSRAPSRRPACTS